MRRIPALLTCVISVLFFISCAEETGRDEMGKPNIILISLDTLRADHLHCYGYHREISPAIDRMADAGILFESTYAQSAWTLPSHVSMLTSLYPAGHGVTRQNSKIPKKLILLPEILKQAGYRTVSFNASGYVSSQYGFDQGFDLYQETQIETGNMACLCDRFISWLEKNGKDRFFAFFHTYEPHGPYSPPESYKKAYVPHDQAARERFQNLFFKIMNEETLTLDERGFLRVYKKCRLKKEIIGEWRDLLKKYQAETVLRDITAEQSLEKLKELVMQAELDPREIFDYWYENKDKLTIYPYLLESYDAEIIFTDDQINRILRAVDRLGLKENTLIVLTSDHGEEFLEHGKVGHAYQCYNEIIHVPLIFYFPGRLGPGKRIGGNTALVDLPPTILDIAGIDVPSHFEGISLAPMMDGQQAGKRPIFSESIVHESESYWPVIVIDGQWKLHYDVRGSKPDELYHLDEDARETVNLAPEKPGIVKGLKALIAGYQAAAPEQEGERIVADEEMTEQLRELGYIH